MLYVAVIISRHLMRMTIFTERHPKTLRRRRRRNFDWNLFYIFNVCCVEAEPLLLLDCNVSIRICVSVVRDAIPIRFVGRMHINHMADTFPDVHQCQLLSRARHNSAGKE